MEIYQLRAFVAVAEIGNVTRAAERLFTSQPAVSAQIKALEQELGITLFQRTPSGMVLTEHGSRLLDEARLIVQQTRSVEDLARHMREGTVGLLRVGLNNDLDRPRLEALTRHLIDAHPDLVLEFEVGTSGAVINGIRSYDLDVGFAEGHINDERLLIIPFDITKICVVLPADWEREVDDDDWQTLAKFPWVFNSPDCSFYKVMEDIGRDRGLNLRKQFRVDHEGSALGLVRSGLAASIIDRRRAEGAAAEGGIYIWPGFNREIPMNLVAMKRREQEKPIAAFIEAANLACAEDKLNV